MICLFVCNICTFLFVCKADPQMRAAARESWSGKLLGEAGWPVGSQVQAGQSIQVQIQIQIQIQI